jgi:hypothetical protein
MSDNSEVIIPEAGIHRFEELNSAGNKEVKRYLQMISSTPIFLACLLTVKEYTHFWRNT